MNIPPKTAIPQRTAAGLNRKPGPMPGKPNIRPPIFTPQTQTTSNDPKQQLSNSKELDSNKDSKEQPDPSLEKPTQIPPVNQEQANPIQSISTKQNQPTQIPPMKQEQPRPIQNMPPKQNPPLQNAFPKKEPSDQGPHIPKEQEKTEPFPKQPVMKQERKETEITGYSDQSSHHHQPSHGNQQNHNDDKNEEAFEGASGAFSLMKELNDFKSMRMSFLAAMENNQENDEYEGEDAGEDDLVYEHDDNNREPEEYGGYADQGQVEQPETGEINEQPANDQQFEVYQQNEQLYQQEPEQPTDTNKFSSNEEAPVNIEHTGRVEEGGHSHEAVGRKKSDVLANPFGLNKPEDNAEIGHIQSVNISKPSAEETYQINPTIETGHTDTVFSQMNETHETNREEVQKPPMFGGVKKIPKKPMGTPFGVAKPSSNLSGEPQPENAGSQTKISREATDQKPEEVFKPEKPSHTLSGQQLAEPVQDFSIPQESEERTNVVQHHEIPSQHTQQKKHGLELSGASSMDVNSDKIREIIEENTRLKLLLSQKEAELHAKPQHDINKIVSQKNHEIQVLTAELKAANNKIRHLTDELQRVNHETATYKSKTEAFINNLQDEKQNLYNILNEEKSQTRKHYQEQANTLEAKLHISDSKIASLENQIKILQREFQKKKDQYDHLIQLKSRFDEIAQSDDEADAIDLTGFRTALKDRNAQEKDESKTSSPQPTVEKPLKFKTGESKGPFRSRENKRYEFDETDNHHGHEKEDHKVEEIHHFDRNEPETEQPRHSESVGREEENQQTPSVYLQNEEPNRETQGSTLEFEAEPEQTRKANPFMKEHEQKPVSQEEISPQDQRNILDENVKNSIDFFSHGAEPSGDNWMHGGDKPEEHQAPPMGHAKPTENKQQKIENQPKNFMAPPQNNLARLKKQPNQPQKVVPTKISQVSDALFGDENEGAQSFDNVTTQQKPSTQPFGMPTKPFGGAAGAKPMKVVQTLSSHNPFEDDEDKKEQNPTHSMDNTQSQTSNFMNEQHVHHPTKPTQTIEKSAEFERGGLNKQIEPKHPAMPMVKQSKKPVIKNLGGLADEFADEPQKTEPITKPVQTNQPAVNKLPVPGKKVVTQFPLQQSNQDPNDFFSQFEAPANQTPQSQSKSKEFGKDQLGLHKGTVDKKKIKVFQGDNFFD